MKKIVTILMLVAAILVGGMTMDAKTTKKKSKTSTSQSFSSQWNGDIPPASVIYSFWQNGKKSSSFIKHGYSYKGDVLVGSLVKTGVCSIEWDICGSGACSLLIYVYYSSKRQWLYNNLKKYIASKKLKNYYVYLFDDCVQLEEVYRIVGR